MLTRRSALSMLALAAAPAALLGSTPAEAATTTLRAVGSVNVRAGASSRMKSLGVLAKGATVASAGVAQKGWQPVTYKGRKAWVSARYLSVVKTAATSTRKTTSTKTVVRKSTPVHRVTMPQGVTANGRRIATTVAATFPEISTMYGRRAEQGSDHNDGRAVDIMLPNYKHNVALGTEIAEYMRAHAASLDIKYVIWNQHIWSVQRSREGWRKMPNRGSDNANHKNHVHVSVT